jgi:leucyl aminopeptidase (aminopeptidase T)
MEENAKRMVHIAIGDDVKKVTVTGEDKDQQVVMRKEISEDDLDAVTGGRGINWLQVTLTSLNDDTTPIRP